MIGWVRNFLLSSKDRFGIAGDLIKFFWSKKMWWLIPTVIFLLLFAILIIFAQGAAVTPFIYTLF